MDSVFEGANVDELRKVRLIIERQIISATKPSEEQLQALLAVAASTAILQLERNVHGPTQSVFRKTFSEAFEKAGYGRDPGQWIDLFDPAIAEILELSRGIGNRSKSDILPILLNWGAR